jgi:hypothetical protein
VGFRGTKLGEELLERRLRGRLQPQHDASAIGLGIVGPLRWCRHLLTGREIVDSAVAGQGVVDALVHP